APAIFSQRALQRGGAVRVFSEYGDVLDLDSDAAVLTNRAAAQRHRVGTDARADVGHERAARATRRRAVRLARPAAARGDWGGARTDRRVDASPAANDYAHLVDWGRLDTRRLRLRPVGRGDANDCAGGGLGGPVGRGGGLGFGG